MNNNAVKITVIVVALAAAGVLVFRSLGGGAEPTLEGRRVNYYICADSKCATEFEVKPGESIAPPESVTEICPTCRKDWPTKAAKCESCGKLTALEGHGMVPEKCGQCGEPLPRPSEKRD